MHFSEDDFQKAFKAWVQCRNKRLRTDMLDSILVVHVRPVVEKWINTLHRNRCRDLKEDMVQKALIAASRYLHNYDPKRGTGFCFICKLAKHRALDQLDIEMRSKRGDAIALEYAVDGQLPERYMGHS